MKHDISFITHGQFQRPVINRSGSGNISNEHSEDNYSITKLNKVNRFMKIYAAKLSESLTKSIW